VEYELPRVQRAVGEVLQGGLMMIRLLVARDSLGLPLKPCEVLELREMVGVTVRTSVTWDCEGYGLVTFRRSGGFCRWATVRTRREVGDALGDAEYLRGCHVDRPLEDYEDLALLESRDREL
jgi:hypothetical protein